MFRRYYDNIVELVELSWDRDLANNALRLCMSPEYGPLLSNLNIYELASHVVILFTTVTTVFRLVLPHPETIVKVFYYKSNIVNDQVYDWADRSISTILTIFQQY